MIDSILDAFLDALKIVPFLFITFFILEYLEHKLNKKSEKVLFSSSPININAFLQRRDYTTPKIERKKMVIEKPQLPF